jgi:hypothetical protein
VDCDDKPRLGDFRRQLLVQLKETLQKQSMMDKIGAARLTLRHSAHFSAMLSIFVDRHLPARPTDISSRHSLIIWGYFHAS